MCAILILADCPSCGRKDARETIEGELFDYGVGDQKVELCAVVPVIECDDCGAFYRGEEAREEAIKKHLGA